MFNYGLPALNTFIDAVNRLFAAEENVQIPPQGQLQSDFAQTLQQPVESPIYSAPPSEKLASLTKKVMVLKKHQCNESFEDYTRNVRCGTDANGKKLVFVKIVQQFSPYFSVPERDADTINERLTYLISKKLSLHVVPTTKVVSRAEVYNFFNDSEKIRSKLQDALYDERVNSVVLQRAVDTSKPQFHLDPRAEQNDLNMINKESILKAIIFNLVVGRRDVRVCNSVLDENLCVYEVDNEDVAHEPKRWEPPCWLFRQFKNLEITDDIKDLILPQDPQTISLIFKKLASKGHVYNGEIVNKINHNYFKLQKFFAENKNTSIKVSDLVAAISPAIGDWLNAV